MDPEHDFPHYFNSVSLEINVECQKYFILWEKTKNIFLDLISSGFNEVLFYAVNVSPLSSFLNLFVVLFIFFTIVWFVGWFVFYLF